MKGIKKISDYNAHTYTNKQKLAKNEEKIWIDNRNKQTTETTLKKTVSEFSPFESTCTVLSPSKISKTYYLIS